VIVHRPKRRMGVERRRGRLYVGGPYTKVALQVEAYLKSEALRPIEARATCKARHLGRAFRKIVVGELANMWGYCDEAHELHFCCRLIFLPAFFLDYLVAHEVPHLVHWDHTKAFWRLCRRLTRHVDAGEALADDPATLGRAQAYGSKPKRVLLPPLSCVAAGPWSRFGSRTGHLFRSFVSIFIRISLGIWVRAA
jgi:hypothetical protein